MSGILKRYERKVSDLEDTGRKDYFIKGYNRAVSSKDEIRDIYESYDEKIDRLAIRIIEYANHNYGKKLEYRDALVKAVDLYDIYGEPKNNIGDYLTYDKTEDEIVVINSEARNEQAEAEAKKLETLIDEIEKYFKKQGKDIDYSQAFRLAGNLLSEVGENYEKAISIVKSGKIENYVWT